MDGGGSDTNSCASCGGSTPVCLQGSCVQCSASSDCNADPTKPICDPGTHTCVACTSDSQCSAKLGPTGNPGVCLSNTDGHCASDAETIYVQNTTGCASAAPGGTAAAPFCSMDPLPAILPNSQTLVVIRGAVAPANSPFQLGAGRPTTSFVGQQSALIASATTPGFNLSSGSAYFRNLTFSSAGAICIQAPGGTLSLDTVVVDRCAGGGIYLAGAAFDIENTTVTRNGPSTDLTWGGIRVATVPTTGPAQLKFDTIENNNPSGVSCTGGISGSGVFATGDTAGDIAPACGFSSCSPLGPGCGAP
jgi:hypothetical protein